MSEEKDCMTKERFAALLGSNKWQTVQQMVEKLDTSGYWDDDELAKAEDEFKKVHVRRMAKRLVADAGHKIFASILMTSDAGEQVRVYKQELLFNLNDYRQVVQYYKGVGLTYIHEANGYAQRGSKRFGTQIPLPFPSFKAKV